MAKVLLAIADSIRGKSWLAGIVPAIRPPRILIVGPAATGPLVSRELIWTLT